MPRPAGKSSPYITPAGRRALEEELKSLWAKRTEVTAALAAAAAEGDRSENAEYIYRKKELRGLDRRIGYLQRRIPVLQVVSHVQSGEQVFFGAWVTLEREDGAEVSYRIVGADELEAERGHISIDSPLARALLGKAVDDEINFNAGGNAEFLIVTAIRYETDW